MNFPHVGVIRRSIKTGTKYLYGDFATTQCFLQPLDTTTAVAYGITFSKAFAAYTPLASDIKEGDELVIAGTTYGVAGVREHNYGSLTHKKAMLELV